MFIITKNLRDKKYLFDNFEINDIKYFILFFIINLIIYFILKRNNNEFNILYIIISNIASFFILLKSPNISLSIFDMILILIKFIKMKKIYRFKGVNLCKNL